MKLTKEGGLCSLLLLLALASVDGGKTAAVTTTDNTKASSVASTSAVASTSTVASTSASSASTTSVSPATTTSASIECHESIWLRSIHSPLLVDQASKMQLKAKKLKSKDGCFTVYTVSETTTRLHKTSRKPIPYASDEQRANDSTLAPHLYYVGHNNPFLAMTALCDGTDKCEQKRVYTTDETNKAYDLQFDYTFFVCCCQTDLCNNPNTTINQLAREYEKHIRRDSNINACYLSYSGNGNTPRIDKCKKGSMCYTRQTDVNDTIEGGCAPDDSSVAEGECQMNGAEMTCFCRGQLCNSVAYMGVACRRGQSLTSGVGCADNDTMRVGNFNIMPPTTPSATITTKLPTTTAGFPVLLVAGIGGGVAVLLLLIIVIVCLMVCHKRKKEADKKKKQAAKQQSSVIDKTAPKSAKPPADESTPDATGEEVTAPETKQGEEEPPSPKKVEEEKGKSPMNVEPEEDVTVEEDDNDELAIDSATPAVNVPTTTTTKQTVSPPSSSFSSSGPPSLAPTKEI